MLTIGDDVVDLHDVAPRHPRFDARVFSPAERAVLGTAPDGDRLRWLLWAAKESAYKAARKQDARTTFSPPRFVVRLEPAGRATVECGARRFAVDLTIGPTHVHAVARSEGAPPMLMCRGVGLRPDDLADGVAARRLAVHELGRVLGVAPETLRIRREQRMPVLWIAGRPSGVELSLSHHGRFVSFACAIPLSETAGRQRAPRSCSSSNGRATHAWAYRI
jgi:4'-phosphopantetheinyl transferase EntD